MLWLLTGNHRHRDWMVAPLKPGIAYPACCFDRFDAYKEKSVGRVLCGSHSPSTRPLHVGERSVGVLSGSIRFAKPSFSRRDILFPAGVDHFFAADWQNAILPARRNILPRSPCGWFRPRASHTAGADDGTPGLFLCSTLATPVTGNPRVVILEITLRSFFLRCFRPRGGRLTDRLYPMRLFACFVAAVLRCP